MKKKVNKSKRLYYSMEKERIRDTDLLKNFIYEKTAVDNN